MGIGINLKVLQVMPFFSPAFGGSVTVPYTLSMELAKRGHDVTIITTDFKLDNKYVESIKKEGVNVIAFHCVVNFCMFLYSPSMKKWLETNIKMFDVIHLHNFRSYQNSIVHHYAMKKKVPYCLQAHGSVLPFYQKRGQKVFFDLLFGNRILKDASKVIALTDVELTQYGKMGVNKDKIVIIPNGISSSNYSPFPKRGRFKEKFGIKDNEIIILYLGRIHRMKGIDLLVDAFVDTSKEIADARLIIVGPDDGFILDLKKQIEHTEVAEKIFLTGPLYGEDVLEAYIDADVYVLPSIYETFPMTVLEAWLCGTPVIVTDRCGITKYVEQAGLVVSYDKKELKEAIIKMIGNEELRIKVNTVGKKFVRDDFNLVNVILKIENVYESCL